MKILKDENITLEKTALRYLNSGLFEGRCMDEDLYKLIDLFVVDFKNGKIKTSTLIL
jgi:hypothetical protein